MIRTLLPALLLLAPAVLAAQTPAAPAQEPAARLTPAAQVASAVAALPEEFRESATVLGHHPYRPGLVTLRSGKGPFLCLADDPAEARFHVACYHRSLEPFMARGRELRARGQVAEVDSVRNTEIRSGRLAMPRQPAALYSLTGAAGSVSVDPATGAVTGARPLYVVYIPFATAESTGLPATPTKNAPWVMFPGTPRAHIMFVPDMQ
jgi:hypothetical protein